MILIQTKSSYIDYINDDDTTSIIVGPTGKGEIKQKFCQSHLQENGQVTERLVNKVAVDFFADQGTGLPADGSWSILVEL